MLSQYLHGIWTANKETAAKAGPAVVVALALVVVAAAATTGQKSTPSTPIRELKRAASVKLEEGSASALEPIHQDREQFAKRIAADFAIGLTTPDLALMVSKLVDELHQGMANGRICMLPSCTATLPTGNERGAYLALDAGGSTFRVSLVHLNGRAAGPEEAICNSRDRKFMIGDFERSLRGETFFDWMADRIEEVFADDKTYVKGEQALLTGLAWSFPIDQWSARDGALLQMGKGFQATEGLLGINLADLLTNACKKKNLNIYIHAIVNDSSATLLSSAYQTPRTPIALILGTGLNAAVHLPVAAFPRVRFGNRPSAWFADADSVVVNTELSMFGKHTFPVTRWDDLLNELHPHPDFQPLEQLTGGRYLSEIVRLVLTDAIRGTGLFGGAIPANFEPYDLTGNTITAIEMDTTTTASRAREVLAKTHPLPNGFIYTDEDARFVRDVVTLISTRAAAYVAVGLIALVMLHTNSHAEHAKGCNTFDRRHSLNGDSASFSGICKTRSDVLHVGCCGGVVEKYPFMFERIQQNLDSLMNELGCADTCVILVKDSESALKGAAIAVACEAPSEEDTNEKQTNA